MFHGIIISTNPFAEIDSFRFGQSMHFYTDSNCRLRSDMQRASIANGGMQIKSACCINTAER
jgi:hypothetical protein